MMMAAPSFAAALAAALAGCAAAATNSSSSGVPNYHGCLTAEARSFEYCNLNLTHEERSHSLISELSLVEKVGLISPDPSLGDTCFAHIHGIPRVDLPPYGWLVECNTGVASSCYAPGQCSTTFAGPTGLGASFDRSSWTAKGTVLSTEMRAFSNHNWHRSTGVGDLIGTSAFGPNLNIIRDPRYGRNSELPGEDPLLTAEYGIAVVNAMQEKDAAGHPRVNSYLKHFTSYSTETNRGHDDYNITAFDFFDTYLPQYKRVFTEANAAGAMCSYNAENGIPSCDNSWLLTDVLRGEWNRSDAYITTDCGVMRNNMGPPLNLKTPEESCAAAINAGTDLEMGTAIWNASMLSAVQKGLVKEETIDGAAFRAILQRMRQGDFDPVVPPSPPRNCSAASMLEGFDTDFGTYLAGSPFPDSSAEHCKALCCANEDCDAYTFAVHTAAANQTKQCWLKSCGRVGAPPRSCPPLSKSCSAGYTCTSGVMLGSCEGTMVPHMDSSGSKYVPGYGPKVLKGAAQLSPKYCQALCCGAPGCGSYTYVTGQGAPGTANCYLKVGGTTTKSAACAVGSALNCTSGVVTGNAPAPVPVSPKAVGWSSIPMSIVGSAAHEAANYQATLASLVLLKNARQTLPIKAGVKIGKTQKKSGVFVAVVGPAAVAQYGLLSDYFGDDVCYNADEGAGKHANRNKVWDCIPTIGSAIKANNVAASGHPAPTTIEPGVEVSSTTNTSGIAPALAAVAAADVTVLVLGIDKTVEHEGVDVANTSLPGLQESFALQLQVIAKAKKTVLILVGDDCNSIDRLIDGSDAIVKVFYPSTQGAKAIGASLFGHANRWGKLPITMYPMDYLSQLAPMGEHTGTSYAMSHPPGRSYRYYTGKPLFSFGTGLSLTTFNFSCLPSMGIAQQAAEDITATGDSSTKDAHSADHQAAALPGVVPSPPPPPPEPIFRRLEYTCTVTNTGAIAGDEVLLVYHRAGQAVRATASSLHPVPIKQLVEFERFNNVPPGGVMTLAISMAPDVLSLTTHDGSRKVYPGEHELIFSTGGSSAAPDQTVAVTV